VKPSSRLRVLRCIAALFICVTDCIAQTSDCWFPSQKAPRSVIHVQLPDSSNPDDRHIAHILAQSVAGVAAKAVNLNKSNEMVWIEPDSSLSKNYDQWYSATVDRLNIKEVGTIKIWEIIRRYHDQGIINGYILYSYDRSKGAYYEKRQDINSSVNVATTVAGILNAILVEESQKNQALKLGLRELFDARGRTLQWCLDSYADNLNKHILLTVDPKIGNNRGLAIAHNIAATYGAGPDTERFCKWLTPPGAILGWNCSDEMSQTRLVTEYGHFQTATNWAMNLPFLSAGSENLIIRKVKNVDPALIDYDDPRHLVCFIPSDGDNLQYLMGGFCFNPDYWANPLHGEFPFSWTSCTALLVQACPGTVNYLADTQPEGINLVEHGGGYYYPDLFARKQPNRLAVLTQHARRISTQLNRTGVKVFSFICKDVQSQEAQNAYAVFAKEIKGLVGMIAFQYYPYDGGNGRIFWVKNAKGIEIPVVTATHSIWANAYWPRGGTPAKIARLIKKRSEEKRGTEENFSVVATHAWSYFQEAPGDDETAENIPHDAPAHVKRKGHRGLAPVKWCIERFGEDIKVVSAEELMWWLRMKHNPQRTQELIQ